jgi:hypothetical protein
MARANGIELCYEIFGAQDLPGLAEAGDVFVEGGGRRPQQ